MEFSFYLLIVLIEYVMLVSTAAPLFLLGKFHKYPNIGIAIWFTLFFSAAIAAAVSLCIATWSILETYYLLQAESEIWFVLAVSFAPWLLLAVAGILIAVGNQKLEPLFHSAKVFDELAGLARREVAEFQKIKVFALEVPGYLALTNKSSIYLSSSVFELNKGCQDAILWHEYGHIRLGHSLLKKITGFMIQLTPGLAVTRGFQVEVARLCEIAADHYALKQVSETDLREARSRFI